MAYWPPLVVDGSVVDLSHLEPFEFTVLPTRHDTTATVSARFNDHCFTETFDSKRHGSPLSVRHAGSHENRAFDARRYALSKALPAIIRALDGQRVASTRNGNLVRVTLQDSTTYPVFFTLRRAGQRRVELFVVSAYPVDEPGSIPTTGEMKFNLALAKVLQGQRLHFPPR